MTGNEAWFGMWWKVFKIFSPSIVIGIAIVIIGKLNIKKPRRATTHSGTKVNNQYINYIRYREEM